MARGHKPKAGSRAFWPRKRAKRIYPGFKNSKELKRVTSSEEVKPVEFAGYKAGMTDVIFTDAKKGSVTHGYDINRAVTVIECPPLFVFGIKFYRQTETNLRTEGMVWANNLKKDIARKLDVPADKLNKVGEWEPKIKDISDIKLMVHTQPRETGFGKKKPDVFELNLSGSIESKWNYAKEKIGKEIGVDEIFSEGEYTDIKSVTKGKGFQGVVKRFGVRIRTRKNKEKRRHIGTMGPVTPARVLPGVIPQAGQLGFQTRTEYNKRIMKISDEGIVPMGGFLRYGTVKKNYILVEGSVPGPKKRLIMLRKSFRKGGKRDVSEIRRISLESQQ